VFSVPAIVFDTILLSISLCTGEGLNAGELMDSLNSAALKQVPVLFVCEDNGLSNVMPSSEHMFAEIEDVVRQFMPVSCADGTDVLSVYDAAGQAVDYVRSRRAPMFLRCRTKRWMKHQGVEPDDLSCNPVDRQRDCPIRKLEAIMLENRMISQEEITRLAEAIEQEIDAAISFAVNSSFPAERDLVSEV